MTAAACDIRRPEAIDANWLTKALQQAHIDAVVRSFEAKPIGTGQVGDSIRFKLHYARGADIAPAAIVGKFPSAKPDSFQAGLSGGNYVREILFYRHLAPTALLSTPRCYTAEVDEASGEFVLLMEDLAPAEQGDQLKGVSIEEARLVTDEAAKLHASHWRDKSLEELPWVVGSRRAAVRRIPADAIQQMWRGFRDRYAERLDPRVMQVSARLAERIEHFRSMHRGPRCLVHHDLRPDNVMLATAAGGRPVTVLDWQSVGLGAGPADLAYFLAGALPTEVRREHEAELLGRYHVGLTRLGVTDYGQDALWHDYASGAFRLLMVAFMSSMRVTPTPRGDQMFMQMATAATTHISDHGALKYLD
jgi:hypothetical protein